MHEASGAMLTSAVVRGGLRRPLFKGLVIVPTLLIYSASNGAEYADCVQQKANGVLQGRTFSLP